MNNESIWTYVQVIKHDKIALSKGLKYKIKRDLHYHSKRYSKDIVARKGEMFDGATGAIDIDSIGWIIHDILCKYGKFEDGTPCNNKQASQILSDILSSEGRWFRSVTWYFATWIFGGGKARANGLF